MRLSVAEDTIGVRFDLPPSGRPVQRERLGLTPPGLEEESPVGEFSRPFLDLVHECTADSLASQIRPDPQALYFAAMALGIADRTQSHAAHEVALATCDQKETERRAEFVEAQVRIIAWAAIALLELVTGCVHHGERATRLNGFCSDDDGNHVDIVGAGSWIVPG